MYLIFFKTNELSNIISRNESFCFKSIKGGEEKDSKYVWSQYENSYLLLSHFKSSN